MLLLLLLLHAKSMLNLFWCLVKQSRLAKHMSCI